MKVKTSGPELKFRIQGQLVDHIEYKNVVADHDVTQKIKGGFLVEKSEIKQVTKSTKKKKIDN